MISHRLNGQEMPAVLLMLIVAVGDDGVILPVSLSRDFAKVAWSVLILRAHLMADEWDGPSRRRFQKRTGTTMADFARIVGPRRASAKDPTGCAFPKCVGFLI
jgi:hypothetical protein